MKNALIFSMVIASLVLGLASTSVRADEPAKVEKTEKKAGKKKQAKKRTRLRHVVMIKFKDDTSDEKIAELEKAFAALLGEIKQIKEFEWGVNSSNEGLSDGLTHCFVLTFNSAKARDAYLPHPAHKKFAEMLLPNIDKAVVVDYKVKSHLKAAKKKKPAKDKKVKASQS